MNKFFSFVLVLATFMVANMASAQSGGAKGETAAVSPETIECIEAATKQCSETATAGAPMCSEEQMKACEKKLADCELREKALKVAYNTLADICGYEPYDSTAAAPKKKSGGSKKAAPAPKPLLSVCAPPAVPSADGKSCKCLNEDGTESDGIESVVVNEHSPLKANGGFTVIRVECSAPIERLNRVEATMNKNFDSMCRTPDQIQRRADDSELDARCRSAGQNLLEMTIWFRSLRDAGKPLNAATWISINQRVDGLEAGMAVLCPARAECDDGDWACRCQKSMDEEDGPIATKDWVRKNFTSGKKPTSTASLVASAEGLIRPDPGTDSLHLRIDATLAFYGSPSSRVGFCFHGGAGVSVNPDDNRFGVAAGACLAIDVSAEDDENRSFVLRPGIGTRAEPVLDDRNNDVFAVGGELQADIRLGSAPLVLIPSVIVGWNQSRIFDGDGEPTNDTESGVFVGAGLGFGGQF